MRSIQAITGFLALIAGFAVPAQTVEVNFDNQGAEAGITVPGATDFNYQDATWSGGVVGTMGIPGLYASGSFSYEVLAGDAEVRFARAVSHTRFFYVHGGGVPAGVAEFRDLDGNVLVSIDSNPMSGFGDPANFVEVDNADIRSIHFSGGAIDNFQYTFDSAETEFRVDAGIEGGWFYPDTAGQGFMIDYIDVEPPQLFIAWFTYERPQDDDIDSPYRAKLGSEELRWFTAQGELIDERTAELTLFASSGGEFDDPTPVVTEAVGTATIEFASCNEALLSYRFDGGAVNGEIPIEPVDPSKADCDQP